MSLLRFEVNTSASQQKGEVPVIMSSGPTFQERRKAFAQRCRRLVDLLLEENDNIATPLCTSVASPIASFDSFDVTEGCNVTVVPTTSSADPTFADPNPANSTAAV